MAQDLLNKKFGKLTVINKCDFKNKYQRTMWHCKCECGNEIDVCDNSLIKGNTKSCGCYKLSFITNLNKSHSDSKTKLYKVWCGIKKRCYKTTNGAYKNYGGRGIKMCDEWKNRYETFKEWALINGYKDGLSIDRIDNNGDYTPDNCRWTTRYYQNRNTRRTHFIEYNGELYPMKDLAKILGIKYNTFANRILTYKWDIEKAINTKIKN